MHVLRKAKLAVKIGMLSDECHSQLTQAAAHGEKIQRSTDTRVTAPEDVSSNSAAPSDARQEIAGEGSAPPVEQEVEGGALTGELVARPCADH